MVLHFLLEEPTDAAHGDAVVLSGAEAHHAAAVRRLRIGEKVTVGDGCGAWLEGTCTRASPTEVVVQVTSRRDTAVPTPRVVLVQALAKGDRDELAVQAATELGIDEIVPWQAARSISKWNAAKAERGRARWSTIAREAAKQAHRPWVPRVSDAAVLSELCARTAASRTLVLEPSATEHLTAVRFDPDDRRDILLVIGPEGGISAEEQESLAHAGARLVRLGESILRTSTAGPAALAVTSALLGRW